MTKQHSSDNASVSTVVVPELSSLIHAPAKVDSALADAFSYAEPSKFRQILLMKKLLSDIFGGEIPQSCTLGQCVAAYEKLNDVLCENITKGIIPVFPGRMSPSLDPVSANIDEATINRFAALGGSVTFSLKCKAERELLFAITDCREIRFKYISMITDRSSAEDSARLIARLTNFGTTVTVCGDTPLSTAMSVLGFCSCRSVSIFDGHILIPGMTVLRQSPPFLASFDDYTSVRSAVTDIAESEIKRLFSHSAKGRPYYKPISENALPSEWALFYPNCLGSPDDPRIRGVLTGGAVYDCISVTPKLSESETNDTEFMERALRYTASACRSLEPRYPLKIVPHYKDRRTVSNKGELIEAVRSHIRIFRDLWGSFSLCISFTEDFVYPSDAEFSSILKGFFGLGGLMITFLPEGDKQ